MRSLLLAAILALPGLAFGQSVYNNGSNATPVDSGGISGGVAGNVPFQSAANTTAFDNGRFTWDSVNHRLGVGTAFPQTDIHVVGIISSSQTIVGQTSITAGNLFQVGASTFSVTSSGHTTTSGSLPTTSTCNSDSLNAGSNDMRGSVTFTGGVQSACTINFVNGGGVTTPFCTCALDSAVTPIGVSCVSGVGTLTISIAVAANNTFTYICEW